MAHHGNIPPSKEFTDRFLPPGVKLGATGQFPQGHLKEDDEGEIQIAIGREQGKVVITFGKPVAWIGFDPDQARELAATIVKHAEAIAPTIPTKGE